MDYEREIDRLLAGTWAVLSPTALDQEVCRFPGIYVLAYSESVQPNDPISPEDILYVGMSNARGGLRGRLRQFLAAAGDGKSRHSGGRRLFSNLQGRRPILKSKSPEKLLFGCVAFECNVDKRTRQASDLRTMGHVACLEYFVLARVKEVCGSEPALNRK